MLELYQQGVTKENARSQMKHEHAKSLISIHFGKNWPGDLPVQASSMPKPKRKPNAKAKPRASRPSAVPRPPADDTARDLDAGNDDAHSAMGEGPGPLENNSEREAASGDVGEGNDNNGHEVLQAGLGAVAKRRRLTQKTKSKSGSFPSSAPAAAAKPVVAVAVPRTREQRVKSTASSSTAPPAARVRRTAGKTLGKTSAASTARVKANLKTGAKLKSRVQVRAVKATRKKAKKTDRSAEKRRRRRTTPEGLAKEQKKCRDQRQSHRNMVRDRKRFEQADVDAHLMRILENASKGLRS